MNCRKVIYLCVVILLNSNIYVLSAQNFQIGVKAGFSLCFKNPKLYEAEKQDISVQPNLGVWSRQRLTKKLFLQEEVLYSARGSKYSLTTQSTVDTTDIKTEENGLRSASYIDIPVLLGYQMNKFWVYAGGQASFLMAARLQRNYVITYTYPHAAQEVIRSANENNKKEAYQPFQYGLIGGLGCQVYPKLGLEARYLYLLSNLYNNVSSTKQQCVMIGATFRIY